MPALISTFLNYYYFYSLHFIIAYPSDMNYLNLVLFSALTAFLAGCSETTLNFVARVEPLKLYETDIYNAKKVADVIFDAEEQNTDSLKQNSRQLFLKGIDAFKNKHKTNEAVSLFKKSILYYPDAKTYYELGNALLESGKFDDDFKEAMRSYHVAEELNFQPKSALCYKMACASNRMKDPDVNTVAYYLLSAFDAGFSDTLKLKSDKYLSGFINSPSYKDVLIGLIIKKMKDAHEDLFTVFKKIFPPLPEDFEIKPDMVDMRDYKQSISYDFSKFVPEMQNSSFGREVSHEFMYVGRLPETENYCAVLYTSVSYFGEYMQPVFTKLVTYKPDGQILSSLVVAGQFSAEHIKSCRIKNNEISIEEYKRVWEQPIDKVAFEDNRIKNYELLAKAVYRIDDSGKIIEVSVPANFKDSIYFAKN